MNRYFRYRVGPRSYTTRPPVTETLLVPGNSTLGTMSEYINYLRTTDCSSLQLMWSS